jgi:hypothetical protein
MRPRDDPLPLSRTQTLNRRRRGAVCARHRKLLEQAAAKCAGDLAGVLASPFRHDYGVEQEHRDAPSLATARPGGSGSAS